MDIIAQFIGFVLGMLSSWVFWRFLLTTKPNIAISPMIAYSSSKNTLTIKVINIGKRQAVDIKAFIFLGERSSDKSTSTIYDPELEEDYRIALGPIQDLMTPWVLPTATRFKILDAKKTLMMLSAAKITDRRLVFTLSSTDALSSTKIVQRVNYRLKDIIPGEFIVGVNFLVTNSTDDDAERDNEDVTTGLQANSALLLELLKDDYTPNR